MRVSLVKAATDRALLGATLTWRPQQLELMASLEGAETTHAWCCSRQSGKSSMAAACAVWNCAMRDDLDGMVPRGRIRYVLVASPSEDQSREFVRIAAAFVEASPILRSLASVRSDRIDLTLPNGGRTAILAMPARDSSARGKSASLVILDEAGHLADTEGPSSDERLFASLTPSTVVFGGSARILLASTPHGEGNLFHRIVSEADAGLLPSARAVRRTIREMNPGVSASWLAARRAELGEQLYEQEYEASFVSGTANFFNLRLIEFDDAPAAPADGKRWSVGLDVGFHNDMTGVVCVAESVHEPGTLVVGAVAGIAPKGKALSFERRRKREDATLAEVCRLIEPYAPTRIIADQHQAAPVRSYFGRLGVPVSIRNITGPLRAQMFVSARARLEGGSLRAWSQPQLLADLRRVRGTGADGIELPRAGGSHMDVAVAFVLGAWELRHQIGAPETQVRVPVPHTITGALMRPGEVGNDDAYRSPGGQGTMPPPGWPGRRTGTNWRTEQF